jgi:hypothetical protein
MLADVPEHVKRNPRLFGHNKGINQAPNPNEKNKTTSKQAFLPFLF